MSTQLFFSCTPSKPNAEIAKNEFQRIVSEESNGAIKTYNFIYTNGIEQDDMGSKKYVVEFQSSLEFTKKAGKNWDAIVGMPFENFKVTVPQGDYEASNFTMMHKGKVFYEGATVIVYGQMTFEKTENGWRSIGYKITKSEIFSNTIKGLDAFVGSYSPNGKSLNLPNGIEIDAFTLKKTSENTAIVTICRMPCTSSSDETNIKMLYDSQEDKLTNQDFQLAIVNPNKGNFMGQAILTIGGDPKTQHWYNMSK